MTEIALQYGLFLAKAVTVVVAAGAIIALAASFSRRARGPQDRLEVKRLNDRYESMERALAREALPRKAFKAQEKARKRRRKEASKRAPAERRRVFVINFRGDIRASAVASLREEVTAILTSARAEDEVLVRLENGGGLVHDHGLAASQLTRIRSRGIPLTVAVDKVAASGGYMMACVANRIIAAPFAVLGSIGVLMQLPNFHRLLQGHGVDFEQIKGGEFKRTLTLFGENSEADRARTQAQVDELHGLFKQFVQDNRPQLDIGEVATGEHWYGRVALERKLCDELGTSDDYLLAASREADLYEVTYATKKPLPQRIATSVAAAIDALGGRGWRERPATPVA